MECWCASQVGLRQKIISINQTLIKSSLNKITPSRALAQSFNGQPVETDPEKQKRYSKRNIDAQAMLDWGKRSIQ